MVPQRFGPYELLSPLGAGGMAETFVAVRRGPEAFEQRVCLKRILPAHSDKPGFVELFLDEARLLAQLRSGSIVQVYDFGQVDDSYYMALELVEGSDLERLMQSQAQRGRLIPTEIALFIAGEVLSALAYAHTASALDGQWLRIVHRDISPSNILLSTHGEVKLTDFGIAKARGRQHKTRTGFTKGKAAYMSPEQVRAEALDGRSDLFAVGIVLFELLTGEHPFDADTDLAILHKILIGDHPSLGELRPELEPSVVALVERLLATKAAQRPESASEALGMLPRTASAFVHQEAMAELVNEHLARKAASAPSSVSGYAPTQPMSDAARADAPQAVPEPVQPAEARSDWAPVPVHVPTQPFGGPPRQPAEARSDWAPVPVHVPTQPFGGPPQQPAVQPPPTPAHVPRAQARQPLRAREPVTEPATPVDVPRATSARRDAHSSAPPHAAWRARAQNEETRDYVVPALRAHSRARAQSSRAWLLAPIAAVALVLLALFWVYRARTSPEQALPPEHAAPHSLSTQPAASRAAASAPPSARPVPTPALRSPQAEGAPAAPAAPAKPASEASALTSSPAPVLAEPALEVPRASGDTALPLDKPAKPRKRPSTPREAEAPAAGPPHTAGRSGLGLSVDDF